MLKLVKVSAPFNYDPLICIPCPCRPNFCVPKMATETLMAKDPSGVEPEGVGDFGDTKDFNDEDI